MPIVSCHPRSSCTGSSFHEWYRGGHCELIYAQHQSQNTIAPRGLDGTIILVDVQRKRADCSRVVGCLVIAGEIVGHISRC